MSRWGFPRPPVATVVSHRARELRKRLSRQAEDPDSTSLWPHEHEQIPLLSLSFFLSRRWIRTPTSQVIARIQYSTSVKWFPQELAFCVPL